MGGGGDFSGGAVLLSVGTGHEERGGRDDEGAGDRHGGCGGVVRIKHGTELRRPASTISSREVDLPVVL